MAQGGAWSIVGVRVPFGNGLSSSTIVIREGRIVDVGVEVAPRGEVIEADGRVALPGLVDIHTHGAAGYSFDDVDKPESIRFILRYLGGRGVTSVVASLASADVGDMAHAVEVLNEIRDEPESGAAQLLGAHLEGPFLAQTQAGAHLPSALRTPDSESVDALVASSPLMITLAPELAGARSAIEKFVAAGTVVAVGHSEAHGDDLRIARLSGVSHVTHLWSGQSGLVREGPWRVPGLLEESLASTALTAEVIADGKHLPPALLEIARRCLGDRLIAVSDATSGAGLPDGTAYSLAGVECQVQDGVGVVVGADAFAGSTTTIDGMVCYLHRVLGWPLHEVAPMVTSRPARIVGKDRTKGGLLIGMDADIAIMDDDFRPWLTIVRGVPVWPQTDGA